MTREGEGEEEGEVPLVSHRGCQGIVFYGILDLTSRHRFVQHAFDLRFQSRESEISFALPAYDKNACRKQ